MELTDRQRHTLQQIVSEPGRWLVATGQQGFNLAIAMTLQRRGLLEWRKEDGERYSHWYPTEAGVEASDN